MQIWTTLQMCNFMHVRRSWCYWLCRACFWLISHLCDRRAPAKLLSVCAGGKKLEEAFADVALAMYNYMTPIAQYSEEQQEDR